MLISGLAFKARHKNVICSDRLVSQGCCSRAASAHVVLASSRLPQPTASLDGPQERHAFYRIACHDLAVPQLS